MNSGEDLCFVQDDEILQLFNILTGRTYFSIDIKGKVEVIKSIDQFRDTVLIGMQMSKSKLSHNFRILTPEFDLISAYSHTAPITDIAYLFLNGKDHFVSTSFDRRAIIWFISDCKKQIAFLQIVDLNDQCLAMQSLSESLLLVGQLAGKVNAFEFSRGLSEELHLEGMEDIFAICKVNDFIVFADRLGIVQVRQAQSMNEVFVQFAAKDLGSVCLIEGKFIDNSLVLIVSGEHTSLGVAVIKEDKTFSFNSFTPANWLGSLLTTAGSSFSFVTVEGSLIEFICQQ